MTDEENTAQNKLSKRTMAIHSGYVGTGYKGSSVNRTLGEAATVEQVLETAMYKAGLISDANFGHFAKIRWSRASRTDKGVHSLGTVMGLRMLVDEDLYLEKGDLEGLLHADLINEHLPKGVSVFAVQKVNKKFDARHYCQDRVYQYYLPASLLDLACDDGPEDQARVELFRTALQAFVGTKPFHNYTRYAAYTEGSGNTQYSGNRLNGGRERKRPRRDADEAPSDPANETEEPKASAATDAAASAEDAAPKPEQAASELNDGLDAAVADGVPEEAAAAPKVEEQPEGQGEEPKEELMGIIASNGSSGPADPGALEPVKEPVEPEAKKQRVGDEREAKSGSGRRGKPGSKSGDASDEEGAEEDPEDEGPNELDDDSDAEELGARQAEGDAAPEGTAAEGGEERRRIPVLRWFTDVNSKNRVTQTYYRRIHSFTAQDPKPLVQGGTPCLLLEVAGQSFMLHHIRHMIGAAVTVALGLLPMEALEASLCCPARVKLPRAPPHTLLLSDCSFFPFPYQQGAGEKDLRLTTGNELTLREGGRERKEKFRDEHLVVALQELVELSEWREWREALNVNYPPPAEETEAFLKSFREWDAVMVVKREAKVTRGGGGRWQGKGRGGGGGRGRGRGRGH